MILAGLLAAPASERVYELRLGDWIPQIPLATAGGIGMFKVAWLLRADPLAAHIAHHQLPRTRDLLAQLYGLFF